MGYSSTKGTEGTQQSTATLMYPKGAEDFAEDFYRPFKGLFKGDYSSPIAQMMINIAREDSMKGGAESRRRIAGMRDISTPGREALYKGVEEQSVGAGAKVIPDTMGKTIDILREFVRPVVGQTSTGQQSGGGGSGGGICTSCFILREAGNGELEAYTRRFRDSHFKAGGLVDRGYRWMAKWLVPQMSTHAWVKWVVKWGMVKPLDAVARWTYNAEEGVCGWLFIPLAYGWIGLWSVIGFHVGNQPEHTPRHSSSHSMTSTFWNRLIGGEVI